METKQARLGALDPISRDSLQDEMKSLQKRLKNTIIFVTHNPEIAQFSSRNIILRDGHITEDKKNDSIASAKEVLASLLKENEQ